MTTNMLDASQGYNNTFNNLGDERDFLCKGRDCGCFFCSPDKNKTDGQSARNKYII